MIEGMRASRVLTSEMTAAAHVVVAGAPGVSGPRLSRRGHRQLYLNVRVEIRRGLARRTHHAGQ
ncbi:hypothetical protein GCM10020001_100550 [Nonomuraea salmonea]